MTTEEVEELLEKTAAALGEHFDAVQVLVSWNEDGATTCVKRGAGNWYARQGMAHEFINADVSQENAAALSRVLPQPPSDDSDSWKD